MNRQLKSRQQLPNLPAQVEIESPEGDFVGVAAASSRRKRLLKLVACPIQELLQMGGGTGRYVPRAEKRLL